MSLFFGVNDEHDWEFISENKTEDNHGYYITRYYKCKKCGEVDNTHDTNNPYVQDEIKKLQLKGCTGG